MLRRLSILVLAFAFVAAATMQLMPHAVAASAAAATPCEVMGMEPDATPAGAQDMPCKGKVPDCADSIGCAVFLALPARPQAAPVEVRWTEIVWSAIQPSLAGLTLEPELTPPIVPV